MSERKDIISPSDAHLASYGLVYSEILGWIDLGHAAGNDIRNVLNQMQIGEKKLTPYYDVLYYQSMHRGSWLGAGVHIRWRVKKGTSLHTQFSIALAMMMCTAMRFEKMQSSLPFCWTTDSGFSAEDLVSDLFGFYRVIRPMNYFPYLQLVSRDEALRRWDHYGSPENYKNRLFRPLLFPSPSEKKPGRPGYGQLPNFMTSIQPFKDYSSDTIKIITNNGSHMNIGLPPLKDFS